MSDSPDTGGKIFQSAPFQSVPTHTGSIQGVWLNPGEEVEWTWAYTPDNKPYVIGYTVKSRLPIGKEKRTE
jgi:hypothetical protein